MTPKQAREASKLGEARRKDALSAERQKRADAKAALAAFAHKRWRTEVVQKIGKACAAGDYHTSISCGSEAEQQALGAVGAAKGFVTGYDYYDGQGKNPDIYYLNISWRE